MKTKEIVIETLLDEEKFITISTNENLISCHTVQEYPMPKMGTLLEYQDGQIIAQYDYKDHDYEIAVVLGVGTDKEYNVGTKYNIYEKRVYEIYGTKTGKGIIRDSIAGPSKVSTGDRLLRWVEDDYFIHNITKARLIYELKKDFEH